MDPLTHAAGGLAVAAALPREPLPKRYVALLAGLALLPDADYVLALFGDVTYLRYHRGVTHSILLLPLWVWLLSLPLRGRAPPGFTRLIAAALGVHILLDLVTSFGTMIYAPFSDTRAALDLVFIIDPIFTASLLLPGLLALMWRRRRRRLGVAALALAGLYLGLTFAAHERALTLGRAHHPAAFDIHALPQPFSPFRWQIIASYPAQESRAFVDLRPSFSGTAPLFSRLAADYGSGLRPADALEWEELPALRAVPETESAPGVGFYRWFARFPVLSERAPDHLEFVDLRFDSGGARESAFRLRVETGERPRTWLVWRGDRKSELTDVATPAGGW